jgi:hypothetical protein
VALAGFPLVLLFMILIGLLYCLTKKCPKFNKIVLKVKEKIFFNGLIKIVKTSYLAFAITAGFG